MNHPNSQPPHHWAPMLPPDPSPLSSTFWNTNNTIHHLKHLKDTLLLAKSMEKELEALKMIKDAKEVSVEKGLGGDLDCFRYLQAMKIDLKEQETLSVEAANTLMSTLRGKLLQPFKFVVDENTPWEEKSAAFRLACRVKKSKRNTLWKKRKRRRVAEMRAKEPERFEEADRAADEWREREVAKDMANRKVEEMKAIEKVKAKRERRRLEPELELALIVEELQELRSLRIQKLKKQGHFLPEEDDKFFESVRAAVELEENQTQSLSVTNTETKEDVAMASKEEEETTLTTSNMIDKDKGKESNTVDASLCAKTTIETADHNGNENVSNLPVEMYHYYYGSNLDMGRLIEIRREWDTYLSPGGRIPGQWVKPSPPANETWASCLVKKKLTKEY
ncbi:unnamed protein product [Cochlearia groenlandica]